MSASPVQTWWSASEIAASGLPDLPASRQGVEALAKRESWRADPEQARRRKGRGGGWEYHWSLLPLAARRRLLVEAPGAVEPVPVERREAWAWYDGLPEQVKDQAAARLGIISEVEALERSGLARNLAVTETSMAHGISARTLWRWFEMVEGVRDDDRLAYLAPRHRAAPPVESTCIGSPEFWERLKALYLRLEKPSFSQSYRDAVRLCRTKGWGILPERTARRRLDQQVPRVVQIFAREGEAGLARCYPPQVRDRSQMVAMEGVNADCHKIDVWVEWEDGTINRPQIVGFQDIYSGKIVSWRVDHTPNKVAVMAAFGEMIEEFGIPRRCLFDNGTEFANKWLTGGTPTRFRFKVREDDPLGVLPQMGIKINWARPASGQSKPIERAFRDISFDLARDVRFAGAYTGHRPDAKPENYGSSAVPIDKFLAVTAERITEHNARGGRRSPTAMGRSFDETFAESYAKAPIRKATDEQRRLWLMGQEVRKLHASNGRFRLWENVYWSEWMAEIAGTRVIVRFDPEDLHAGAYVYGLEGAFLGYAACQQKVGFFDMAHAKEEARRVAAFRRQRKRLLKAERSMRAGDLAAELDVLPRDEAVRPEAKVVRPEFGAGRGDGPLIERPQPERRDDPEAEARHEAFVTEFRVPEPAEPLETEHDRFRRALVLEERLAAEGRLGEAEETWLRTYQTQPEYRGLMRLYEDFGEAMFAE